MPVSQRQSDSGGRKKFGNGKNVNHRLAKPSSNNNNNTTNGRFDKSERNGLLLLSAKKSSTGGLLSSKSTSTNNNHKPIPHLNLQAQSNASTHQVLLSAVVGASQQAESHSQPDAWGVADKQHASVSLETAQREEEHMRLPEEATTYDGSNNNHSEEQNRGDGDDGPRYEMDASWDEYGGRGVQAGKIDEQASYMSRLAKERADLRRQEEEQRFSDQRSKAAQRLQELDERAGRPTGAGGRKLWEPEGNSRGRERSESDPAPPEETEKEQVIHLTSYEDRDRGQRNGSSAPRMLFDPKSGSMVEVKSRDESANAKRKERKPRHRKDRDSKPEAPTEIKKNVRKVKGRKESLAAEKTETEKSNKSSRRLPRTCGVLYGRNEKGNLVCQDECDGDLGYGCHSVHGGRVRNQEAYQKFVDEHAEIFQKQKELLNGYDHGFGNESPGDDALTLETGFNLEEPPQPLEWVKADDKIELITGADDSPTLKPTAKAWAPSQRALAAAAAAAAAEQEKFGGDGSMESVEDAVEDEPEDDDEANSGLGFDPLQDMNFMSSPSHLPQPEDAIASVDLQALSLEPAYPSTESASAKNNIFAFGSSTWGTSGANENGVLGWGSTAGSENNGGLFGTDVFRSTADDKPAGFLSIPPTHSWGSSAIPGLGNLSAAVNHESASGTSTDG